MTFIEEKTPSGLLIKILLKKWQFLAFDRKGKSIYVDNEGRNMLHRVPLLIFVGKSFDIKKEYDKEYTMLKVRKKSIIIPYRDLKDKMLKYFFIQTDKDIDLIPFRMMAVSNVANMVKEIDVNMNPDYIAVDEEISSNDIIIIKSRYKVDSVIHVELVNNYALNKIEIIPDDDSKSVNLNMMSTNPVFLARIHIRSMELSKIKQLLLDFDITALDTEYILNFIQTLLDEEDKNHLVKKNKAIIEDLKDSFKFYHALLQKNDDQVKEMISTINELSKLAPFRTLVSKVKSMFPGKDDQLVYSEYEAMMIERRNEIS